MKTDIRNHWNTRAGLVLTVISATIFFTSCVTYYAVVPEVHSDGSMTRTVYADADSACLAGDLSSHPFLFEPGAGWETGRMHVPEIRWFLDDSAALDFYARRTFEQYDSSYIDVPTSEEYAALPYLRARERWDRKKGLFFNTYTYTCVVPGIADGMPVPPDSCMSGDEVGRWFRRAGNYPGMNGVEAYVGITELYDKYTEWVNVCYREQIYRIVCSDAGEELADSLKNELMQWMGKHYDFYEDMFPVGDEAERKAISLMADIAGEMSRLSGSPAYADVAAVHAEAWREKISAMESSLTAPFFYAMLYQVRMPGRLTSANTDLMDDGFPVWKVDGYRLLAGDLTIEATSRQVRPLGFILLGLVILVSAAAFFRPRRY